MRSVLFFLLILQPFINKITKAVGIEISVINELISMAVLGAFLIVCIVRRKVNNMVLVMVALVTYMTLLGFLRGIMPLSLLQVVIYSQFFFYFYFFQTLSTPQKHETLRILKRVMSYIVIFVLLIAIWEFVDHHSWRNFLGVYSNKRGINDFYLISFFGSGPSLAIFMALYVMLWHYVHYALGVKATKRDRYLIFLAIALACLSFSRKEVLFIFLFLVFFPYPSRNDLAKWVKRGILALGTFSALIVYYISFFEFANTRGLSSEYIRWKIIARSAEIYGDYFPLGTGAGTFGSRVSLMMPHIYEEYGIGQDMLGWKVLGTVGPIYDSFLFTFTTEIGIGLFIFLFFVYKLFEARNLANNNYAGFCKNFTMVFFIVLSLFVPMLVNTFGFFMMIIVACMIPSISILKYRRWSLKGIKI